MTISIAYSLGSCSESLTRCCTDDVSESRFKKCPGTLLLIDSCLAIGALALGIIGALNLLALPPAACWGLIAGGGLLAIECIVFSCQDRYKIFKC